ncbi:hypothetical protein LOZ80_10150 [Paenibacillus sp. HWE-109]|uniref:hypothetical protein n=1 Tax=Paenibacillus sp. HWE-109 TaxID=1306526 RepID=UPI001EDD2718|nr:hypothetical protein [Paenibacillus sp. HWE-109]UKS29268.1 hypothetical protein LOZ80_10150 [Paenibacillus sp. HWE-109]
MINVETYLMKKFELIRERFDHLGLAYDNHFFLQYALECFVNVNDLVEMKKLVISKRVQLGKVRMRVFNTAVIIEHNGDYILNFNNYDSDQWSILLDILDQLFKQNYGTGFFHQNRLTLTMESLVNDQVLLNWFMVKTKFMLLK